MSEGTVNVISTDPPCKDTNVQFTMVPWKPLSDEIIRNHIRLVSKFINFLHVIHT